MTDLSFVRTEMLPQHAPPLGERGIVKWLRENLFSSVFNAVLTIIAVFVIGYLLSKLYPWLANSMWAPTSIDECRAVVAAAAGEGASGACWGVVRERWHQWLFGFYPPEEYWRPSFAFAFLLVAIAPVLFSGQRRALLTSMVVVTMMLGLFVRLEQVPTFVYYAYLPLMFAILTVTMLAPRWLLAFTVLYPALCFWLLWGGSVWMPIFVLIGLCFTVFVGMWVAPRAGRIVAAGIVILLFAMIFFDPFSLILNIAGTVMGWIQGETIVYDPVIPDALWNAIVSLTPLDESPPPRIRDILPLLPHATSLMTWYLPFGIPAVPSSEFGGFLLAITIGVTGIAFSLPFGILLALGRQSDMPLVKYLSVGFIELIRGVPLITLLFTASLLLMYFMPPGTKFDIILRVIILVTLFAAAYLAEVIRGGLAALPRGQYEAADALGLDYWRAQRLIILPQALKISIPSIVSTFIGLFKDTTLVSFVGLLDPLRGVTTIVRADLNWKAAYWEPYIFVGAIFFVICFSMSRYSMYLEQKLKTDRH